MTQFNPENKSQLTYRETLGPAMDITDQADADQYKEAMIQFGMKQDPSVSRERAESVCNQNLGYYAGYYSHDVRERVERLFKCSHPIFGSIKENGAPTDGEALMAGIKAAKS
jgi:hypothetical protein